MSTISATQLTKFLTMQNNSGSADASAPEGGLHLFASGSSASNTKLYMQKEGSADVLELGASLNIAGDSGAGTVDLPSGETLTIAGGTGLDTSVSGQTVTFSMDLNELSSLGAAPAAADLLAMVDATDNSSKKVTITNLADLMAGTVATTGLSDASGVLKLDIQNMTANTSVADADLIATDDGATGTLRKMTRANFLGSAAAAFTNGLTSTTISGSSTLHVGGIATFGNGGANISATGIVSSSALSTLHRLTVDRIVAHTADINAGTIDGATIGASSQSSVKATTLSGSSTLDVEGAASFGPGKKAIIAADGGLTIDHFDANWTNAGRTVADLGVVTTVDINGGSIDGTAIGAAATSTLKATTISGSGAASFGSSVTAMGNILPDGDDAYDLGSSSAQWKDLYIDGTANIDSLVADTADIDGGTVDNVVIGGSTQAAGSFTTISGSGACTVLNVTTDKVTAATVVADTLDVNTINSITTTQNSLEIEDYNVLAGLSGSSSQLDGGGFLIGGQQGDTLGSLVWNDSNLGLRVISGSTQVLGIGGNYAGLKVTGRVSASSDLQVEGSATIEGNVLPASDDAYDLGSSAAQWKDLYIDGTANIDSLVADTADINGGTADNVIIGGSTQAAGSFTTVSGSSGAMFGSGLAVGNSKFVVAADGGLTIPHFDANWTNAGHTVADLGVVTTVDINGGSIDGATIGAASQSSVKATTLSGSSTLDVEGVASFGPGKLAVIAADGGLTISHFDANWTNAGHTVADLGVVSTVDINGGTVDNVIIGGATQAAGSFTTMSGSAGASVGTSLSVMNSRVNVVSAAGGTALMQVTGGIDLNGSLNVTTAVIVGGGYGNSGLSVDNSGNLNMDGNLKVGTSGLSSGADFAVYGDLGHEVIWDSDASNHKGINGGTLMVSGTLLMGQSSATSGYAIDIATGYGNVRADAFVTYSDRELKKDIAPIENSLDKVMKLEAVSYNMKHSNRHEIGFVAQEVAKVVPEICALDSNGIGRGIDYGRLTSLLAGAVQTQQGQIAELKAKIEKLQE